MGIVAACFVLKRVLTKVFINIMDVGDIMVVGEFWTLQSGSKFESPMSLPEILSDNMIPIDSRIFDSLIGQMCWQLL